jgi:hypothetical protein
MGGVGPGWSSLEGLKWLGMVGPASLDAWGVAMSWGRSAAYSHGLRLRRAGLVEWCPRTRGEGALVYASRSGVKACGVSAAVVARAPVMVSWHHHEASAWTAAWLTARGRGMVGPREMLLRREWRGDLHWHERGESRRRGHRPDLAGQLPDGRLLPIEVELTGKSNARLNAVLQLHAGWVAAGRSPAVMYVCTNEQLAERVKTAGQAAGLSIEHGTLRVELLPLIRRQAIEAAQESGANQ